MSIDESTLQGLVDKQAIYEAMMRYCRGVDRCDGELMRSVYHEDATDHHGEYNGPAWAFADMFVKGSREESLFTQHLVGNFTVDLDGDLAATEAYFVAYVGRREGGSDYVDAFGGRYVDQWEKREGVWGVVAREVVHEWSRANAFGTERFPLPAEKFAQPRRDGDDLAYRSPGAVTA
jgi:hypothetical protein